MKRYFYWISNFIYNLRHYLRNIVIWSPILWSDGDWDYDFLTRVMEFKIRQIGKHIKEHSFHVDKDRDTRECLIAAELLRRINEENYYKIAEKRFPDRGSQRAKMIFALEKQDEEMLFNLMRRKMRSWWC